MLGSCFLLVLGKAERELREEKKVRWGGGGQREGEKTEGLEA